MLEFVGVLNYPIQIIFSFFIFFIFKLALLCAHSGLLKLFTSIFLNFAKILVYYVYNYILLFVRYSTFNFIPCLYFVYAAINSFLEVNTVF
jgi:hypothetical protein